VVEWLGLTGWTPRGRHLFVFDLAAIGLSIAIAFGLRFDASDVGAWMSPYLPTALIPLAVLPPTLVIFGLYRWEWRYASVNELFALVGGVLVGMFLSFGAFLLFAEVNVPSATGFPRSVFAIEGLLIAAMIGGCRFALRAGLERRGRSGRPNDETQVLPTIVYGAGDTGVTVARVAARDPAAGLEVVGFLDDEPRKRGSRLLGKPVFGGIEELERAVKRTGARQLVVAIPEAPGALIRHILDLGGRLGLEIRTVPHPRELLTGGLTIDKVRRVSVEDLLRREPITIDLDAVAGYLNGASVLVTGGGGSIGSELVRQILSLGPRQLTVLDHHEAALWQVERELEATAPKHAGVQLRTVLADVRSLEAMTSVIRDVKPDVVFHAAALKHVPLVEIHPSEGVMTNVVGTYNTLLACQRARVERFVLISTDKAVDPIGVMGTTKRMAEHLTVAAAQRTRLPYVAVRFGNVLGSSGSVIPTFQQQLARGGPLTITHPDVTRYFMTISEAVSLILEAASTPRSGDIYVLDMGEPVRIVDLANDLIRLSGLDPATVPIVFTGLRSGERLHENLFHDHEITEPTIREGILLVRSAAQGISLKRVERLAQELATAAGERDDATVRELLKQVHDIGIPTELDAAALPGPEAAELGASPGAARNPDP
jgi:FlaA1/EpsC-like NDP-sugar epimerase